MYAISKSSHTPKVHNIVLDIPVPVYLLKPIGANSFEDDAQKVTSQRSSSIEVIWDISQILSAPERRVNVTKSSVTANPKTPSN